MVRSASLVIVMATIAFLAGCGATMRVAPEKQSAIDAVAISDKVVVTDKPQFISGVGRLFAPGIGGATGAMIDAAERDKDKQYVAFLKAAGIDVASIVKAAFEAQLREHLVYGSKLRANATYRFELEVPFHALVQKTSFTDYYRANVSLRIKLVGPSGEVLGEGRAQSCLFGDCVPQYKLDEIRSNPGLLKIQYEAAAKDAARQVLEGL